MTLLLNFYPINLQYSNEHVNSGNSTVNFEIFARVLFS